MSVPSYCPPRFRDQLLPVVNRTSDITQLSKMCFISGKHTCTYFTFVSIVLSDAGHVFILCSWTTARRWSAASYCHHVVVVMLAIESFKDRVFVLRHERISHSCGSMSFIPIGFCNRRAQVPHHAGSIDDFPNHILSAWQETQTHHISLGEIKPRSHLICH